MNRRNLLSIASAWLGLLLAPLAVQAAEPFPVPGKIIHIVIGVPAGGGLDAEARLIALVAAKTLGTTVIVDNKPGANGLIAFDYVAKARPDGYTVLYTPDSFVQVAQTTAAASYDPLNGFVPISQSGNSRLVLVAHKSIPATNLSELAAYAKANPGRLTCAAIGAGSSSAMFAELMSRTGGFNCTLVPYKGFSDVYNDLVSGRVHLMFAAGSGAVQFAKSGQARMLAVAEASRSALLPDVPTLLEQGYPGFEMGSWTGFFGPAGMDAAVVRTLNAAIAKALSEKNVRDAFAEGLTEARSSTPEAFQRVVKDSYDKWGITIKQVGMQKK